MSSIRWTTGVGIAVGGLGGALAALMGSPDAPVAPPPSTSAAQASSAVEASAASSETPAPSPVPSATQPPPQGKEPSAEPSSVPASPLPATSPEAAPPPAAASATPAPSAAAAPSVKPAPALDVPSTREALLKAEMLCDRKKDFDACSSAALALEQGTTGPADADQAKRFRRIALTHLVAQCEVDSPHACFVLADKYRAGVELAAKPNAADALERRGLELCRLGRTAPECPAP